MDQNEPIDQSKPIEGLKIEKFSYWPDMRASYCRQLAWLPKIHMRNEAKDISAGNHLIAWLVLIGSSTFS